MPEFSVIVPVYKVENYICRCIDSILAQTFTDFELILVDDGTPDKSGELCDQYAAQDKRIHVLHQENRGVSAARNAGLDMAKGKYIVFVDSDDEIEDNYLSCMAESEENIDLIVSGIKHVSPEGTVSVRTCYKAELISELTREHVLRMIQNNALNFIYDKRYKREIIEKRKIRFTECLNLGEDTEFVSKYVCVCQTMQYIEAVSYLYYEYTESTLSAFTDCYVQQLEEADSRIARTLSKAFGNIEETDIWRQRCFKVYHYSIFYILKNKKYSNREKHRMLKSICKMEKFRKFTKELDTFMCEDSKLIRRVIATRSPFAVLIFWDLLSIRNRLRRPSCLVP